jgi:ATPase involved in DNA repair
MRRYLLIASLFLMSFMSASYVADILKQLQIAEDEARSYIFENFQTGTLNIPYSKMVKNVAVGKRAEAVRELGDYIRKYTESAEFINAYNQQREAAKPQGAGDIKDRLQKRLEEIERDINTAETDMKSAGGDMKKLYEATIKMLKEEQKALKNPKDPMHPMYLQNLSEGGMVDEEQYEQELKNFEASWPATAKELVKIRLREFLNKTADIDFDAKLVQSGGRKKFADPRLEKKDGDWKRCFRAGKETIDAARAYAQQWLNSLR